MNLGEFAGVLSLQAVIAGLATWLGNVWATRIARNEQVSLDERLKRVEATLSAGSHVTKAQYEREFAIYQELWDKMLTATGMMLSAPAIKDAANLHAVDHRPKQLEMLNKAIGEFGATVQRNRPFYADSVFEATKPISEITTMAWAKYQLGEDVESYAKWAAGIINRVIEQQDAVREAIRSRMKSIGVA